MSRRRRELSGLERALWRSVTRDVAPIDPKEGAGSARAERSAKPAKAPEMPAGVRGPTGGLDRLAAKLSRSGADPAKAPTKASPASGKAAAARPRVLPPSYTPPQSRPGDSAKRRPDALEPRVRRKLGQGRAEPDARIDLHGMRQAEALEALRGFVLASRARGHRLVLVVTGKGEPVGTPARLAANEGRGVIRRAVPRWLALPDMAPHVVGFEQASRRHGGEGALYLRLRR